MFEFGELTSAIVPSLPFDTVFIFNVSFGINQKEKKDKAVKRLSVRKGDENQLPDKLANRTLETSFVLRVMMYGVYPK